jgi:RHS repeat-associated protein
VTQCSAPTLSLGVNTSNRITNTGFSYDPSGNVQGDGTNSYTWDAESQIKVAAGVNYTYDGDGNRIQKSSGKLYWYGSGTEILDESDLSGNITDEYVFFGGKRIAHRTVSSGNMYYYAEDFIGSSRVIIQAGQTTPCYDADFYPFGGERTITNNCPQNYKFQGKERDAETGNDDFGARYYSSSFGRWLSPDWSSIPAPVPYADLTNPQTLNLYAMVRDNPETFADLDGHFGSWAQASAVINTLNKACGPTLLSCNENEPPTTATPQNQTAAPQDPQAQNEKPDDKKKEDASKQKQGTALAGVGVAALGGSELGPGDLLVIGAALTIAYSSQIKTTVKYLEKESQNFLDHVQLTSPEHNPDSNNRNKWTKDLRRKLDKMGDKLKKLPDKLKGKWEQIIRSHEGTLPD